MAMARVTEGKYGAAADQEARTLSRNSSAMQGISVAKHRSDMSLPQATVHIDAGGSVKQGRDACDGVKAMRPVDLLAPLRPSYADALVFLGKSMRKRAKS